MGGTPFDLEEQAQTDGSRPQWNPWNGPAQPSYFAGLGYDDQGNLGLYDTLEKGVLSGVAKGQQVLGSLYRNTLDVDYSGTLDESQPKTAEDTAAIQGADENLAQARARVKRFTPDAATTGGAAQLIHGLASGITEMAAGGIVAGPAGAAAVVGAGEGVNRTLELEEQGVDSGTAKESGVLSAVTSALGAVIPGGVGSTLAAKIASGVAGNTTLGIVNRYADHKILESAGYTDMANQQKVLDSTQVLTDMILGGGFGYLAHLHSPKIEAMREAPGARDAALTTNLALKDRDTAPGIPVDPEAANAHQAALEKGIADLMDGRPVDVSDANVHEAGFLERDETKDPQAESMVRDSVKDPDLFGEGNARDLQDILDGKEPTPAEESRVPYESPGTLYHGTNKEFSDFRDLEGSGALGANVEGLFHFTNDRDLAQQYADTFAKDGGEARVVAADVKFNNPKVVDGKGRAITDETLNRNQIIVDAARDGHDGVIFKNVRDPVNINEGTLKAAKPADLHIAFKNEQIKQKSPSSEAPVESRDKPEGAPDDSARILAEKPGLTIPDENGNPIKASDALARANEEVATTKRESTIAAKAAIQCYMRRGA